MKRCVYLIKNSLGNIKIGVAKEPEKRYKTLKTANADPIELLYFTEVEHPFAVEKSLHNFYKSYRMEGEWFLMPNTFSLSEFDRKLKLTEKNMIAINNTELIDF